MNPNQLFRRTRKSIDLATVEVELGANYLELLNKYFLEDYVYPNEVFESIKEKCGFLYDYKSYHIGYFLKDGRFYSFAGLSSKKHVEFNSKSLVKKYEVAMIGSAFIPTMSMFVDINKLNDRYESIFVQEVTDLENENNRIYVANNMKSLINDLTFYIVGNQENLSII